MLSRKAVFLFLAAICWLSLIGTANAQFGKNIVRYSNLNQVYYSQRFDVRHNLDRTDPRQEEYLREVAHTLESARDWMSSYEVFDYRIEGRIPVFLFKTHRDLEASNLVGGSAPEGLGAFVEFERQRMVLKADFPISLARAIIVHELVHEFQINIMKPGFIRNLIGPNVSRGYIEGCAEYIAGLYDPHTRDEIRRREQRTYASNPKTLPTWTALHGGRVNPYTMWSMVPEFLEDKHSIGLKFCTRPLKQNIGLGEYIYDMLKGELGNPDINSEKFDQAARYYWGTERGFELMRINRPKPYEENDNFRGWSITSAGHPYPMFSPILSPDGSQVAVFTILDGMPALGKYKLPKEWEYTAKEDREKNNGGFLSWLRSESEEIKNLTPQLPPIPWEYLIIQGLETWSVFDGFDAAWSHDGTKIAFFARINKDHALVVIDAESGKVIRKIELPFNQAFSPSFNATDHWVYFSAVKESTIIRDIYAVNIEEPHAGLTVEVTDDERFDTAPSVSKDGSKVVYVGRDGDFQHLFIYDVRAGTKEQLTFGQFNDSSPSWSDDGTRIVYISDEADMIWNIYTLDLATRTVSQWTEFIGEVRTPIFARNSLDTVYYSVFRDDDQFLETIYQNFEIFAVKFKKPINQYTATDNGEPTIFAFNPNRNLFKLDLDSNQLLNPVKPEEDWKCRNGTISFGVSRYWDMFGQSYFGCSNMLETKQHLGLFVSYYNFKFFDYLYQNQEKRTSWRWGGHYYQMPASYQSYDIIKRYPAQVVLNNTLMKETALDLFTGYPMNKFNRWELFSRLRHRTYSIGGAGINDLSETNIANYLGPLGDNDYEMFRFLKDSSGSNLSFGVAYVRDTVIGSSNVGLSGVPAPFHGNALRTQLEIAPRIGEEFQGYVSANISARTYRHLGSSSVFAGRVDMMTTSRGNGDFMLLCGPELGRGCRYGSQAGNQALYGSAELRFPIPGTYILYQNIRGFLFVDGAVSKFSNENYPVQKLKAYGFGAQYILTIPFIGAMPAQSVWSRENGKWKPTFYITWTW